MPQPESTASAALDSFDVLVVGSGAAGLYATLCLPSQLRIGLITKDTVKKGSSNWAQGGIAAAIAPSDSPHLHVDDTLRAGAGLCDSDAVEFLVEHAKAAIESLVHMGVAFDRKNGQLAMTLEAAHSRPRVLHAADTTGKAIISTLATQVLARPHIHIFSHALALNLWIDPVTGCCQGIRLLSQGQVRWLRASAVILATGGGGQVFSQTTNPSVSTGDGVAMAWRAGASVRDLEFFQFHPTALTKPGAPRFLISEAVRGEGAHLVDEGGDRFAFQYHPSGELAPRDVVSRAIFSHLQTHNHVYLDLTPIDRQTVQSRFPNIIQTCDKWGVDVLNERIPVAPAAHYWMGGVATDTMNRTSIPGLYAIGEVASTGVHGANRLASNSLLECLVFAARLATISLPTSRSDVETSCPQQGDLPGNESISPQEAEPEETPETGIDGIGEELWASETEVAIAIRQQLPQLMWKSAGISRRQQDMDHALSIVNEWRAQLSATKLCQFISDDGPHSPIRLHAAQSSEHLKTVAETMNLIDIAYLILKSAAWRTESRGGHYRSDHPHPSPEWHVHTVIQAEDIHASPVTRHS